MIVSLHFFLIIKQNIDIYPFFVNVDVHNL